MLATAVASLVIGAHVYTAHAPGHDGPALQDFNPGLYAKFDTPLVDGVTVGLYRNSYDRWTVYGGKTWETSGGRFALTLGLGTGYKFKRIYGSGDVCPAGGAADAQCWRDWGNSKSTLRVIGAASVAFPEAKPYLLGATPRLSLVRGNGFGIHLSIEKAL